MGRVYVITLLVNLIVSRRATSPYAVPEGVSRRKLSFSAEMMMTFSAWLSSSLIVRFTLMLLFVRAAMPRLAPRGEAAAADAHRGTSHCRRWDEAVHMSNIPVLFSIFFLNRRLKRFDARQRSGTGDAPFVLTLVTQYAMRSGLSKNNLPYLATHELNISNLYFYVLYA